MCHTFNLIWVFDIDIQIIYDIFSVSLINEPLYTLRILLYPKVTAESMYKPTIKSLINEPIYTKNTSISGCHNGAYVQTHY